MTNRNWNAADYAKNSSAQLQWAQELIQKISLNGDEAILDIGCGDGKITSQLSQAVRNGTVVGIDSSEDMIRFATEQFPQVQYPNLSFQRMDATRIALPYKFDVAFSNAVLHWVKDHLAVLRGVKGSLNTGGRILFQMGGRGNGFEVFEAVGQVIQRPEWRHYFVTFLSPYYFYGLEEYDRWLSEYGFRPVRIELIPKEMQHHGAESFLGWLRTTWFPYTDCLPIELRETFLSEVIYTYIRNHPVDSGGNFRVKMVRLEVEAYTS